ncbi:MAG: class I SAM-dependent DNA methyltransferase [Rhodoferax sp.]|nr:class I SAM-dependent DNA methyltransferase [Rhodoferax sp.]
MTVALNKTEILHRAHGFVKDYADARYEMGDAQNFIRGLCDVFGFSNKRLVSFEQRVQKLGGGRGRIDGFYPGKLLIEMKSRGEDLEKAYQQATEYLPGLKDAELPDYILVSDFEHLHLYQHGTSNPPLRHKLDDFSRHIDDYLFLAGFEPQAQAEQIAVNESAARKIAQLHDAMRSGGYTGADLERYLVRLVFCLFAEDTGIFERRGDFGRYLRQHSREDGTDLDGALQNLFDTLNRPRAKRPKNLPPELQDFPYINGSVFDGQLAVCYFDSSARHILLDCSESFDWAQISPAIFGSLFQAVIHHDDEGVTRKSTKRRELGAHYTSETNILRVIGPLFLDALKADFNASRRSKKKLTALLHKLRSLTFLDPACGCGNFLVIAYREIRRLELDTMEALQDIERLSQIVTGTLDAKAFEFIQCDVHQCHGIEIEPSAAHIATVALWLTDHQENQRASRVLGGNFNRLPLDKKANIVCANALTTDWASVLPPELCDYVIGNPPFVGKKEQTPDQKACFQPVVNDLHGSGVLDFVAAWYVKAARYALTNGKASAHTRCAFVSTNSITQGEQVGVLWGWMLAQGIKIQFAHRTFQWSNDAKGVAAVHCVIIGFGPQEVPEKTIYEYPDIKSGPVPLVAKNISPYLVDAPDVVLSKKSKPISLVAPISEGSALIDDGHFLLTQEEAASIVRQAPFAKKWIRKLLSGDDFINGRERLCLWLVEAAPAELRTASLVLERVARVREFRAASNRAATQKLADLPTQFGEIRQPVSHYLFVPKTSSENRQFVPIAFVPSEVLVNNTSLFVDHATPYLFGVMSSTMHNAWLRFTCGRLKNDYRYSANIVYNNYPWPTLPELPATADATRPTPAQATSQKKRAAIEAAAQAVLDARASFPEASLADLYDPLAMPPALSKAHQQLDKAVDAAYAYKGQPDDASRVASLFGLYQSVTSAVIVRNAAQASKRL